MQTLRTRVWVAAVVIFSMSLTSLAAEMPRLAKKDGRYALLVDGQPFLILGAQINNSSGWPASLPRVWPAIEAIHANTVEAPVYWEQLEPQPGKLDFTCVDDLVKEARTHRVYLVLLWFGTWKNGKMHYVPEWVKKDPAQFPRVVNERGDPIDVLSANSDANLEADKKAFAALMQHLKQIDGEAHTVLMVQVENESGSLGSNFKRRSQRTWCRRFTSVPARGKKFSDRTRMRLSPPTRSRTTSIRLRWPEKPSFRCPCT
jgi:beta-galactosidase GanA